MFVIIKLLYEYLKPGLILWDNIESRLNPWLLARIISWFNDIPGQIVVTTRNISVANDLIRTAGAKCFVIDIKDGKLIVKEISKLSRYLK